MTSYWLFINYLSYLIQNISSNPCTTAVPKHKIMAVHHVLLLVLQNCPLGLHQGLQHYETLF